MKSNPITFAILLALAVGNLATSTTLSAADSTSSLKSSDEKFVKIATLGTQKAERTDVKDLATMLVTDHTKANAELTALAESKKVQLSAVINPKAAKAFEDLEKVSGKDFDKAFLKQLEKDHKDCISNFEDAEKNAEDADVKSWASKTLPTLRAHLDKVKELAGK
jgi:putative membrane protein